MVSRKQVHKEFHDTLTIVRETIRVAVIDSLAYPSPPKDKSDKYYNQKLYHYRRLIQDRDESREWFRANGSEPSGFSMMWEGLRICGGPQIPAEAVVDNLRGIWAACDKDPSLAIKIKEQVKMASTIFGVELCNRNN